MASRQVYFKESPELIWSFAFNDIIEQAKREGKYTGRKPIEVDENILRQVSKELDEGIISVEEAMRRTKIKSRSTFYRKMRGI